MPKKIKKKEENKHEKITEEQKIKKARNTIVCILIIGILIMLSVGMFIFFRDRGYKHSENKVLKFSYSEGIPSEGFDVYELEVKNNEIFTLHNLGIESKNITKNWTETKYLNFNEELWESGVLEFETKNNLEESNDVWTYSIEIYFENGETYVSHGSSEHPENTEKFRDLIKKYFDGDIKL